MAELEQIRGELPDLDERALDSYVSLVDAHEDELAWDYLVFAADRGGAPLNTWKRLHAVAESMDLDDAGELYGPALAVVRQHRQP